MKKKITSMMIIGVMISALLAQSTVWEFDMAHSKISFVVDHMVISQVEGRFDSFTGSVISDKSDFSDVKTEIVIDPKTIDTDNERRDGHLRSPDFFDADKFPEIRFVSTSVRKTGNETYLLTGDFTMHGVTKKIELDVKHHGTIKDPRGNTRAGFKVTGTIDRKEWGLVYNSILDPGGVMTGEDIEIVGNIELVKK